MFLLGPVNTFPGVITLQEEGRENKYGYLSHHHYRRPKASRKRQAAWNSIPSTPPDLHERGHTACQAVPGLPAGPHLSTLSTVMTGLSLKSSQPLQCLTHHK